MTTINIVLMLIVFAVAAFIVGRVVVRYRSTTGTTFQRLITTAEGSATILWQYVLVLAGAVYGGLDTLAQALNMPELKQFIDSHLSPQGIAIAGTIVAMITIAARLRTLFTS